MWIMGRPLTAVFLIFGATVTAFRLAISTAMRQVLRTLPDRLSAPVDIAALVAFRLGFGAVMVWEAWRFLSGGKVDRYFIEPTFFFKYLGFERL